MEPVGVATITPAVGEEEAQYLFSHLHLKVDDAREAALGDYEVVEGVQFVYEPSAAPDLPLEEPPELEGILPVDDGFYIFLRRVGVSDREEAEASEVYPVERHIDAEGVASGAQKGPVPAEDDGEGCLLPPDVVRNAGKGDRGGLVRREQEVYAVFFAPAPKPPGHLNSVRLLGVEEQPDFFSYFFHVIHLYLG